MLLEGGWSMKKFTLGQTMEYCHLMWLWIKYKIIADGYDRTIINDLKQQWCREHGFGGDSIHYNCFFCDYATGLSGKIDCSKCPARILHPELKSYWCEDDSKYYVEELTGGALHWRLRPMEFADFITKLYNEWRQHAKR